MPSEQNESQRAAARGGGWPEVPPAWPDVPPASGPPPGRPFQEPPPADPYGQRPYRTGEHPVLPPPLNEYDQQPRVGRGGTDPFGRPVYRDPQAGPPQEPQHSREPQPRDFQMREPWEQPREQQFRDPQQHDQQFRQPPDRRPREPEHPAPDPFSTGSFGVPQFEQAPPRHGNRPPEPPYPEPQYSGPQHTGPQQTGPQHLGPQHTGPQYPGPQQPGPQHPGPQQSGPQHMGPQHPGPQQTGPQHMGPQHTGPQHPGPQQPGPQQPGPQQPGPRDPQTFGMVSPQAFGTGETPLYRAESAAPPQQAPPASYNGPQTGEHGVPQFPMAAQRPPQAPPQQQHPHSPGEDPYKPFVTAGQISGPKTPPAHRQQELWNTVFGENYQAIDEYDDEEERGRPIWLFALAGSVLLALIGALLWAFLAGPLAGEDTSPSQPATTAKPSPSKSGAAQPAAQSGLPVYEGTPSPVQGRITDAAAHVSVPQLGGQWKADLDEQTIQSTYGYVTRQFVNAGLTTKGKPQFAQVMTGPLAQDLAAKFTTADDLRPVLSAVVLKARQNIFPKGNKVAKVGQQKLKGGIGQLAAYKVSDDGGTTLVVVAAVNTGAPLPSIVYMQVPDIKDDLLPDVNTVFKSIKVAN
ncbi:hypothetical protein [Acrocarpospora corrugata]|nr:hypothetical protein [Acrocarpospora corrugata]